LSFIRILHLVKNIGKSTINLIKENANKEKKSLFKFLNEKDSFEEIANENRSDIIIGFISQINYQIKLIENQGKLSVFLKETLEKLNYYQRLKTRKEERTKNVEQLFNMLLN
jgi:hypothetical protein